MSEMEEQNNDVAVVASPTRRKSTVGGLVSFMPMVMVSLTFHLFIFFIISLIPSGGTTTVEEKTIITEFEEKKEEEKTEIIKKIELEVKPVTVDTTVTKDSPSVEKEVVVEAPVETPTDTPNELMELLPDASNNNSTPNLAVVGLSGGTSGGSGLPTGYSKRSGKAKTGAIRKGGGDAKSEASVDVALQWLALHQEPDGSWDASKYEGESKDKGSTTAVALLALLGAGHNEAAGKYRKNVKAGIKYLNQCMADPKMFNIPRFSNNYGNALVLMALAEDTIFGASPTTKKNANRIAEVLIAQYVKDPEKGGWGYGAAGVDLSVSGWVALGLKSAKAADLPAMHTPDAKMVFDKYKTWVDQVMTDPKTGLGYYTSAGAAHSGQHMTWVGMFNKQFLGFPLSDPFLKKASEVSLTAVNGKKWIGGDAPGSIYGIYYGTLAAFQQQGALWEAWNPAMKKTVVGSQKHGDPKELGGSWDPTKDHVGYKGGRVMTTALFALCLEVYYRYDMMQDSGAKSQF